MGAGTHVARRLLPPDDLPQAGVAGDQLHDLGLREVVWVQEEPRNVGARAHMFPRLMQIMPDEIRFGFIGRPERASPGEGYPAAHIAEQNRIVTTAIDLDKPISQYPRKSPGQR